MTSPLAGAPLDASPRAASRLSRRLTPFRIGALTVVALALLASASSLGNGFAYDDVHIIARNARVHSLHQWWRHFAWTYWPPPHQMGGLYRPLTTLAFALEWVVGGGAPWIFHLVSVTMYAAASLLVFLLAATVLPPAAAWAAAALFAVHPVHVEAVGNVVGQSELLVAVATLSAVLLYVRVRRAGGPSPAAVAGIAALYAVACLSKEHGILLPPLLLAAELFIVRASSPGLARARRLAPLGLALVAVGVGYMTLRYSVPGVSQGESSTAILRFFPWRVRLLTTLEVTREWARLFFWPARLSADYSPQALPIVVGWTADLLPGVFIAAATCWLAAVGAARSRAAAFGIVWAFGALAIASDLIVPTGVLLAERTLFLPSVGVMIAVGAAAAWLVRRTSDASPAHRAAAAAAFAALLVAGTARSATRQLVWRDDATLFAQGVLDAPLSYKTHWSYGSWLFDHGKAAQGEREIRIASRLFPLAVEPAEELALRYQAAGMCEPAVPLFRHVLRLREDRAEIRVRLVTCLLTLGSADSAGAEARRGMSVGAGDERLERLLRAADSASSAEASPRARDGAPARRAAPKEAASAASGTPQNATERANHLAISPRNGAMQSR